VAVGRGAVIGPGSVVVSNSAAGMVAAGNPAKVINAVNELTCRINAYKRPYLWPPYTETDNDK